MQDRCCSDPRVLQALHGIACQFTLQNKLEGLDTIVQVHLHWRLSKVVSPRPLQLAARVLQRDPTDRRGPGEDVPSQNTEPRRAVPISFTLPPPSIGPLANQSSKPPCVPWKPCAACFITQRIAREAS